MMCPTCGASVADGARYCSACGHPMASRGDERRVVTVVFADLVGFTTLAEARDPEQVKNFVDACFEQLGEEVTAFGGRVDNIIGDAIVAMFGAPLAHEDDAERAVRAGLRMQDRLRAFCRDSGTEVQLRVGVNTGEVLVGSLRAAASYTAMGDVVNTADRLQEAATPGSVVVGPATYAATREVIGYEPLGSIGVKGREETVDAWIARAPLLPPGYRPRRMQTPFVGRDPELGILRHAIDVAFERSRAHLVLLLGEAGVGKSRLAEEASEWARREQRGTVLEGRCVPYGEANVWWPVAEALRDACGVSADDPLSLALELCTEVVALSVDLPADSDEVARIVHGLLYLMGYEGPLREIDPQRAREEATRSVLAFVEGTALSRPVVVVLSDLHWADDVVLEMIDVLIERLSRARVVVIATARPELQQRWTMPSGRHNSILVNLDPLDRGSTAALLDALAESDLDADMRTALLDRSGGNPFFLEELVALVAPTDAAGADRPVAAGVPELPGTLRGLVAARIDGLSDLERATVQDASVWGRRGPVVALERMAEQIRGQRQLAPVLDALVDKDILVVDGQRWSFRSDLIREVSYGTLTKADRARRHHGIARFLEHSIGERDEASERLVDVIAHHYAATAELVADIGVVEDVPADVRGVALDWIEEAARRAEVGQVLLVAERLYAQALDLLADDQGERRVRVLLGLARAETGLRHLDAAEDHLATARAEAEALGADDLVLAARVVLGDLHQKRGDFPASVSTLLDAAEALQARDDVAEAAEALRFAGMSQIFMGGLADAEASIDRALALYRHLGDVRGEAWALQNLAWISYVEGRTDEAEARITVSADTFRELGDTGGTSWAMGLLGFVRFHQGRLDEAEELGERALREGRERGDRWGEGMMLLLTAGVRLWSGRAAQAGTAAHEAVEVFRAIEDAFGTFQASATYGRALVTSGQVGAGLDFLREGLGREPTETIPERAGALALSLACSLTQVGEPEEALAAIAELGPIRGDVEDLIAIPERIAAEGLALVQVGRPDEARSLLEVRLEQDDLPPYPGSALVVVLAALGATEEALALADRVTAGPRATYLDVATAVTAAALVRARSGDEEALNAFADLIATLDATEDLVSRAVARLAEAQALEALDLPSAELAMQATERMLVELGIDAHGWRRAFAAILVPRGAPHPA
jgi:class 3 adenylate cyclase/tetratricopeptide (TPR) repeat protein